MLRRMSMLSGRTHARGHSSHGRPPPRSPRHEALARGANTRPYPTHRPPLARFVLGFGSVFCFSKFVGIGR